MSDEESFVILGTSPTASMDTEYSISATESLGDKSIESTQKRNTNNDLECQLTNSAASSSTSQYTVVNNSSTRPQSNGNGVSITQDKPEGNVNEKPKVNSLQNSGSSNCSLGENLAASFILGEVNSTVLKTSLQSQFPNVLSLTPPASVVYKPEDIVEDYTKLRNAVIRNNQFLKSLSEQSEKWKKEFQEKDEKKNIEIAKLRNENLELRKDMDEKVEQFQIQENLRVLDQKELIRSISEKQSQIKNMSAQIQKLEQHQLQSYDFIPRKDDDTAYQSDLATEYVTKLQFQQVVDDLQKRISELLDENKKLKDMQEQYIDELNCLQVNLVAAEELQKQAQSDIRALQTNDLEKAEAFSRYEATCKTQKEEIDILRQQLDLYCRDFKSEKEARENLANEKDQLISDLRELQKKNQELIKEAHKNYEQARQTMAPTGAFPKRRILPEPNRSPNPICAPTTYACPLCAQIFKTLSVLQEHVNQCLDGN